MTLSMNYVQQTLQESQNHQTNGNSTWTQTVFQFCRKCSRQRQNSLHEFNILPLITFSKTSFVGQKQQKLQAFMKILINILVLINKFLINLERMTMSSQLLLLPIKTRKVVQYTFLIKSLLLYPHVQIALCSGASAAVHTGSYFQFNEGK